MHIFSSIRCVTFDLDDTLWPCEPTILNAEQALYSWLQNRYPRITQQYSFEGLKEQRAAYGKVHPELAHDVTALRRQSLAELAKEFDYSPELASEGLVLFRKFRNRVTFFDDAFATIDALKKHFKIGAITNGNADLDIIGVRDKFDFVVTAEKAGAAKPDKKIFQYAQNQVQLASNQIVLVGDTPHVDMLGAKLSGWRAIWFNPQKVPWLGKMKPDAEVQQLNQLRALLIN
ncbi:MAG: HAD-IA family hydrolase [Gammaproteobacteria bacterium]|nr:HAD-IA family hydrolase [Gammaproteobacteria bacterium]